MAKKAAKVARDARVACEKWRQGWKYNIDQYNQMMSFVLGRQWTSDEEDMLKAFKKIPMQNNKLGTLANTLLGEQQQNTPQFAVNPLSDCDEQTAEIRSDLVKDIMIGGNAKPHIQIAAKQAIIGGFGALLVDTEYLHNMSFDQSIVIRSFKDATKCYWSLDAEHPNKIDSIHSGYHMRLSKERAKTLFGKDIIEKIYTDLDIYQSKEEIALITDPSLKDDAFTWADDDGITFLYDYHMKYKKETLYKMSNGKTLNQEEMDKLVESSRTTAQLQQHFGGLGTDDDQSQEQMPPSDDGIMTLYDQGMPVRIEESRVRKVGKIIHRIIAGDYILEETTFPSEHSPLIFMDQNSWYDIHGKQFCRPFIIDAVDAQKYINFIATQSAYMLKISRYDQFLVSKKNVASLDTQRIWRDPNNVQGGLLYDESPNGNKPEQLMPPELSQSLLTQYQRAMDDLYTSTGMYPARLGQQGNEVSGAAIDSRTKQGSYSTFVVFNSINMAVEALGTVVNEMIPNVYDTERVIGLMNSSKGFQRVTINKQMDPYGEQIQNDMTKGTFQVKLVAGPSYEGQKELGLESLDKIFQAKPELFGILGDLYADNLPLSNALEIKNRIKTIIPPDIIEAGKTGKTPPQKPQQPDPQTVIEQQKMQIAQGQLQLKAQELQQKSQQNQSDYQVEIQKLQKEYAELEIQMQDMAMRSETENNKTAAQMAMNHHNNFAKILTHNPGLHNENQQKRE